MQCVVSVPHHQITTSMTIFSGADRLLHVFLTGCLSQHLRKASDYITRAINLPDLSKAQGLPALSMDSHFFVLRWDEGIFLFKLLGK